MRRAGLHGARRAVRDTASRKDAGQRPARGKRSERYGIPPPSRRVRGATSRTPWNALRTASPGGAVFYRGEQRGADTLSRVDGIQAHKLAPVGSNPIYSDAGDALVLDGDDRGQVVPPVRPAPGDHHVAAPSRRPDLCHPLAVRLRIDIPGLNRADHAGASSNT